MRNFTHRCPNSGHFFPNLGQCFPIFEKGQGKPPPLPPSSCAPSLFVCESAVVPGVYILLCFLGEKVHSSSYIFSCTIIKRTWTPVCDYITVTRSLLNWKKHKQQKHKLFIVLVVWPSSTLKLLFDFDFK